jgi:hypothetical protein
LSEEVPVQDEVHCSDLAEDTNYTETLWPESASELYRPSDHRLSAKLVPTFADRGCHVVSMMDPCSRILRFLDCSHYFFLSSSSSVLYSQV